MVEDPTDSFNKEDIIQKSKRHIPNLFKYSILLLLGAILGYSYVLLFGFEIGSTDISPVKIQAVATILLVLVTGAYVILTWKLVSETRSSREQEIKPVISLELEGVFAGGYSPKLVNIGNGPAIDVNVRISLEPDGDSNEIQTSNIAPGDFTGAENPQVTESKMKEYEYIEVSGTCRNLFGNMEKIHEKIKIGHLSSDIAEHVMKEDSTVKELEKIRRELDSIKESIEMDGLEDWLTHKNRGVILKILENNESLTINELSKQSGWEPYKVANLIDWMKETPAIEIDLEESSDLYDEENWDKEIRRK